MAVPLWVMLGHDLFRKPVSTPDQVRGRLFRDHALMARGVTIDRVSFGYGPRGAAPVLDVVSLEIEPGEFFAFLGPSGSGKTTLLRLIAGFGTPSSGRILIGGRDVTALAPWSRNV